MLLFIFNFLLSLDLSNRTLQKKINARKDAAAAAKAAAAAAKAAAAATLD